MHASTHPKYGRTTARYVYTSDVSNIASGNFLIKFPNWGVNGIISGLQVFHTSSSNSSIIHVLDTCFNKVNHLLLILLFIQKHFP